MNAPSEKIMFLWNFCHLFSVLLYNWNSSINDSFQFFQGFFWKSFPGKGLHYSIGGLLFSCEGASFLRGPRGASAMEMVWWEGLKNHRTGGPPCPTPYGTLYFLPKPCTFLFIHLFICLFKFISTERKFSIVW